MPRPVQQHGFHLFRFRTLWQHHLIRFLLFLVGIEINDLNPDLQVVQKRHDLNLISFLVHLFDFHLAEHVDGEFVVDECLVEEGVVLHLARGYEAQHED